MGHQPKDRLIEVRSQTSGRDSAGAPEVSWEPVGTLWASITEKEQRLPTEGSTEIEKTMCKIETRYADFVTTKCRIVMQAVEYQVTGVVEVGRKAGLAIAMETFIQ